MKCLVCDGEMAYYFTKTFNMYNLRDVEYWKCSNCGFVISKTHFEMTEEIWGQLNVNYHQTYQNKEHNPDDPRWIERLHTQAKVIDDAARTGFIKEGGRWLDYACGDGQLASILKADYGRVLLNYDKYMPSQPGFLEHNDVVPRSFDFVLTTSVFEHFTRRAHFDAVESLVAQGGVLGLHTLVCESIPKDPDWFYLLPVHCAFHTNKSMSILLKQWGYTESIYNVEARMWLFFKSRLHAIEKISGDANTRLNEPYYIYKNGFVDYWK